MANCIIRHMLMESATDNGVMPTDQLANGERWVVVYYCIIIKTMAIHSHRHSYEFVVVS